ncbi:MAG: hypothetical protein WCJ19_01930 [bacterium]
MAGKKHSLAPEGLIYTPIKRYTDRQRAGYLLSLKKKNQLPKHCTSNLENHIEATGEAFKFADKVKSATILLALGCLVGSTIAVNKEDWNIVAFGYSMSILIYMAREKIRNSVLWFYDDVFEKTVNLYEKDHKAIQNSDVAKVLYRKKTFVQKFL